MEGHRQYLCGLHHVPVDENRITRANAAKRLEIEKAMAGIRNTKNYATAALKHEIVNDHTFDFEGVKVLAVEPKYVRRKKLESLYICLQGKNSVNCKVDTALVPESTKKAVQLYHS